MTCRSYQKQFFTQFSKAQWYSIVRKNTKVWGLTLCEELRPIFFYTPVERQIRDKTPKSAFE